MRILTRLYVVLSCLLLGSLLGAALFFTAALFMVPEWVGDVSREASRFLGSLAADSPSADAGRLQPASVPGADGTLADAAGTGAAGAAAVPQAPPADAVRAATARVRTLGGLGGLESNIARLENDLARWKESPRVPAAYADPVAAGWLVRARLEAWERLRGPLMRLVAATGGERETGVVDERFDVRRIAERLAAYLDALAVARRDAAEGERRITPDTLVCLLVEDRVLDDAEALRYLEGLSSTGARRVIDRLSRLAPERAARLLRTWSGRQPAGAGRLEKEDGATAARRSDSAGGRALTASNGKPTGGS